MYPRCEGCLYIGPNQSIRIDSPDCPIHGTPKIEIDTAVIASIFQSAVDSLRAADAGGMKSVYIRKDMTLRDFMRFCLGVDYLGDPQDETENA